MPLLCKCKGEENTPGQICKVNTGLCELVGLLAGADTPTSVVVHGHHCQCGQMACLCTEKALSNHAAFKYSFKYEMHTSTSIPIAALHAQGVSVLQAGLVRLLPVRRPRHPHEQPCVQVFCVGVSSGEEVYACTRFSFRQKGILKNKCTGLGLLPC